MAHKNNNKTVRQSVALVNKENRIKISDSDQLRVLDQRPGKALRERTRLGVRINLLKKGKGND